MFVATKHGPAMKHTGDECESEKGSLRDRKSQIDSETDVGGGDEAYRRWIQVQGMECLRESDRDRNNKSQGGKEGQSFRESSSLGPVFPATQPSRSNDPMLCQRGRKVCKSHEGKDTKRFTDEKKTEG